MNKKRNYGCFSSFMLWLFIGCLIVMIGDLLQVSENNGFFQAIILFVPILGVITLKKLLHNKKVRSDYRKKSNRSFTKSIFAVLVFIFAIFFILLCSKDTTNTVFLLFFEFFFIAICLVALFYSFRANSFMKKHKFDVISLNDSMNASVDLDEYFKCRKQLIGYLEQMSKNEFLLYKGNQFTEKPSLLLKQLYDNKDKQIHSAIERMSSFVYWKIKKYGIGEAHTFYDQIQKYEKELSPENYEDAMLSQKALELYEKISGKIEEVDMMDGHQFEYWCADLLEKNGFSNVQVTRGSGDQGVDILAKKDGIKYAIQCKCYSSNLSNKPIQEVHAGKSMYQCQVGIVMTNRYFTSGAQQLAEATGVLLWDRDKLQQMIESAI